MEFHLAQANIARMRADADDPLMADFISALDRINALAERSDGFVWRYKSEQSYITEANLLGDPRLLLNMSVWSSMEHLKNYVYQTEHLAFLKAKQRWFEKLDAPHLVLWWIPQGHVPDLQEGLDKLNSLKIQGPNTDVFTFARPAPKPNLHHLQSLHN